MKAAPTEHPNSFAVPRDFAKQIQNELEAYQALHRFAMNESDASKANHFDGHVKALEWVIEEINKRSK